MGKHRGWAFIVAWVFLGLSSSAYAAGAADQAAAEALFRQGRELMRKGSYAEACSKLEESQRLDPGAGTLLNLAACYAKNGQSASAWATYGEAATFAARSGRSDWETTARERAHKLEPTLSTLTIVVPGPSDVPGLQVERDGEKVERAQWGLAIPVDPGVHPVTASAPEKQRWSTTITVGDNAAKVSVSIPPLLLEQGDRASGTPTSRPSTSGPTVSDSGSGSTGDIDQGGEEQRTWGLVLGGVGLAGVAAGSVVGWMAKSKHDEALTQCDADNRCSPDGLALDDQARGRATVSTVLFGAGAAALLGGSILYFTAPSADSDLRVGAAPTGDGAAFSLQGAW